MGRVRLKCELLARELPVQWMSPAESSGQLRTPASPAKPLEDVWVFVQLREQARRKPFRYVTKYGCKSKTHTHLFWLTFCLSSLPALRCGDSARGLIHEMHISLIAGLDRDSNVYLPGRACELFFGSVFNFFLPSRFREGPLWDGCDEMEHREGNLSSVCTITFI